MATGVKALKKYIVDHQPLPPLKAIAAFCADCMGEYEDGPQDCQSNRCPLHPYMPYNPAKIVRKQKVTHKVDRDTVTGRLKSSKKGK